MRRSVILVLCLVLAACTTAVPDDGDEPEAAAEDGDPMDPFADLWPQPVTLPASWAPDPDEVQGLARLAHTDGTRYLLRTEGGEIDFLPGVNVGPTIPGHHPGEVAVRAEDYRRWFPRIADLGLRVVRVYTIQRPVFYDELVTYNEANPDAPLYVVHGVWIPEERFIETEDLWDDEVVDEMRAEIGRVVDVVHGDTDLPDQPGHASGTYTADITPWLAGWILGVELDPEATAASDLTNVDRRPEPGTYVTADEDATPTEQWLGEMLDHLAMHLAERGLTMPLAFTNWPTTDPLSHPDEPIDLEDLVDIDASALAPTSAWPGGLFASYHAYPYYPDFLRHEERYATYEHDGRIDNYAGYLAHLREHHDDMPTLITEFGIPSSLGSAHHGPLGRGQGDHREEEATAIEAELLEMIHDLGFGGGFVFAWTDEWFKLTWNTMDLELPAERRPLWLNQWTNEQVFGLVAVEPGDSGPAITLDGTADGWPADAVIGGDDDIAVAATHDEAWVRLLITGVAADEPVTLGFDTGRGGAGDLPEEETAEVGAADVAVTVPAEGDEAQAWIRAALDPVEQLYERLFDPDGDRHDPDDWVRQRLIVNRPLTVPTTGETFPMETQDVGRLVAGTADPRSEHFDSHATWSRRDDVLELRLPWMLLGVSDPSSRQVWRIVDGAVTTETIDRLGVSVVVGDRVVDTQGYTWEDWTSMSWHERPKAGLDQFAEAVQGLVDR